MIRYKSKLLRKINSFYFQKFNCTKLSTQQSHAKRESDIKQAVVKAILPVLDIHANTSGIIQSVRVDENNSSTVHVDLNLYVPGHPDNRLIINECDKELRKLDWVNNVNINIMKKKINQYSTEGNNLANIEHVIAVSSCKGGVGKSTVAVNLAFTLAKQGNRVGLLDADIFGPSLPHLVTAEDPTVRRSVNNPKHILPITQNNVKMLSFAHVNPFAGVEGAGGREAAVLRGPQATKVIQQLVAATEWGDLDYLIVDFPPGTGDIQLTLCQSVTFTGAVVVTTPHRLAIQDVKKGLHMFQKLKVPVLAVVNNMSHFRCRHGELHYPFGNITGPQLEQYLGVPLHALNGDAPPTPPAAAAPPAAAPPAAAVLPRDLRRQAVPLISFPISDFLSGVEPTVGTVEAEIPQSDSRIHPAPSGASCLPIIPSVLRFPDTESSLLFQQLADGMIRKIFYNVLDAVLIPTVTYSKLKKSVILRYLTPSKAEELYIPTVELRIRDPSTGLYLSSELADRTRFTQSQPEPEPVHFDFKGSYGVAINWSDGYFADIYSFDILRNIALECSSSSSSSDDVSKVTTLSSDNSSGNSVFFGI